jgi:hypothetical protein
MAASVKYKGETIATAKNGQTVEIDVKGHSFSDNIFVRCYGAGEVSGDSGGSSLFKNVVPTLTVKQAAVKLNLGNYAIRPSVLVNKINNLTITKGA